MVRLAVIAAAAAGLLAPWALGQEPGRAAGQERQKEQADGLRAKSLRQVRDVLDNWDEKTWDEVLAEDAVLEVKMGDVGRTSAGGTALFTVEATVKGREDVKKALQDLYKGVRKQTTITTEILSEDQAVLIGHVRDTAAGAAAPTQAEADGQGMRTRNAPLTIYLHFDEQNRIDRLSIASVDLRDMEAGERRAKPDHPQK